MPKHTNAGAAPVVFLLYGRRGKEDDYFDEYLAAEHITRIRAAAGAQANIAISEYDASDPRINLAECLDELFTPALWGGTRLVMLRAAQAILAPPAADRERFQRTLERMTAAARSGAMEGRLILVAGGLEVEGGSPRSSFPAAEELIAVIASKGGLCSCVPPYGGEMKQALIRRAAKAGVRLLPAAADALVQAVGTEQMTLQEELDKLLAACGDDKIISVESVQSLASEHSQATVFTLADKILDGDVGGALADLRGLRETPATRSPAYMLPGVTASFRRYLSAASAMEKGRQLGAVLGEMRVPDRFQGEYIARLKRWNSSALLALLERALACDVDVKLGGTDEDVALESFVSDACRQRFGKAELVGGWLYET